MTLISTSAPIVDGLPVEADSAKLSDPTGTYGIRRLDTMATVVADGTDLVYSEEDEEYQYDFDDAIEGIQYEAWFELEVDGSSYWSNVIFTSDGGVVSVKTLSFAAMKAGEILSFGSYPQLASPAGQFGVKNISTGAVVLESGAVMGPSSGGEVYSRVVPVDSADDQLKFYVYATVDEVEFWIPSTTAAVNSVILAIGRYTNSFEIGQRFGVDNMHLWLSSPQDDRDEPIDYLRRAYRFITEAEDLVDEAIRGPFVSGPFEDDIPTTVSRLATELAGVLMYEARGVDDVNPETNQPFHRLWYVKRDVLAKLRRIQMGLLKVSGSSSTSPSQVPIAGGYPICKPNFHD